MRENSKCSIRLALIQYRDHPPEDDTYVTVRHNFTSDVGRMESWLSRTTAKGGGDQPEAVADALWDAVHFLSWRKRATKVCVMVCDSPPHGLPCHWDDAFRKGCPEGHDPLQLADRMADRGIILYVVGCEPAIRNYRDFYKALAHVTGGQYVPLKKAEFLAKVIIGGSCEELSLHDVMEDVTAYIQEHQKASDKKTMDVDGLAEALHQKLQLEGKVHDTGNLW